MNTEITGKWVQMVVSGKQLTQEQVCEIYLKTDSNLNTIEMYNFKSGTEHLPPLLKAYYDFSGFNDVYTLLKNSENDIDADVFYKRIYEFNEFLHNKIQTIDNYYVTNNWTNSSFIFGAYGWCNPDGNIKFIDNIGKYPDSEDIVSEWETLADAFPYLDIHVTIMSDENCVADRVPLFNLRVLEGKVFITEPDLSVHTTIDNFQRDYSTMHLDSSKKCGLQLSHVYMLSSIVAGYTDEFISTLK